jgi:hypothetical protein
MKKNAFRFVVSALVLTGSITVVVKVVNKSNRQAPPNPISVFTVLQAHGGYNQQARSKFTQTATLTYYEESPANPQIYRERKLNLSTDGSFVRLEKTFFNNHQILLSNETNVVRITYQQGSRQVATLLSGDEDARARFQLATVGLLPILKRICDPQSTVDYIGGTANGNQFHVKNPRGSWDFYTNSNHLIERVEVNGITITYADYRTVDGLNLPFYQQVRDGNKLLWEIRLDRVDFNPVFADGYFKSDLL